MKKYRSNTMELSTSFVVVWVALTIALGYVILICVLRYNRLEEQYQSLQQQKVTVELRASP